MAKRQGLQVGRFAHATLHNPRTIMSKRTLSILLASAVILAGVAVRVRSRLPQPPLAQSEAAPREPDLKLGRDEPQPELPPPDVTPQDRAANTLAAPKQPFSLTLASTTLGPQSKISDGFSGSSACRECHTEAHASWHASFHRTMTQEINAKTAPAAITNQTVTVQGKTYRFETSGDQFFVVFPDPLVGYQVRRRELVLMTGSHHMHVFWYASDVHGTPGQLDIVFLNTEQRWIPRDSSFLRPNAHSAVIELGTWNRTCSRCHATHPKEGFNQATEDWNTVVTEFGIACEACHGEGAGHIARHASSQLDGKDAGLGESQPETNLLSIEADHIINPSKLSKQASADVCGQCHSIFVPNYDAVSEADYMQNGNPFRPGELLSNDDFTQVVRASPEFRKSETFIRWSSMEELGSGFWSDGMPRIAGREYNGLIESPCFENGEMTCLSCHTMHPSKDEDLLVWRDDQLKPGMRGDLACLQCHQEYEDRVSAHTHHPAESEGSRCMNCHMPHTTYGLLKTIRSHQISSPSIQTTKTSDRPDACSLCHLDQTFDWVSQHLSDRYGQKDSDKSDNEVSPVATSVLHLLSGDAAQRAVQVAAMGWEPAQKASGTDWMESYLLLGLNDPYDAVRMVAARSMKTIPGRRSLEIDPLAPAAERMQLFNQSIESIDKNAKMEPRPPVLVDKEGRFDFPKVRRYLELRNHRPIYLRE